MALVLLEELEDILKETNYVKRSLNLSCENIWSLLKPSGSGNEGAFVIEKQCLDSQSCSASETVCTFSVEGHLEDANKLIALGKLLRETAMLGENKCAKNPSSFSDKPLNYLQKSKALSNPKTLDDKCKSFGKELSTKLVLKKDRNAKLNNEKKSVTTRVTSLNKEKNELEPTKNTKHSSNITKSNVKDNSCKDIVQSLECSRDTKDEFPTKYSHVCSLSSSNMLKTITVPHDLQHLFKEYHNYQSNKQKNKGINATSQDFKERFSQLIKSKLDNDLKASVKHTDRYTKYLNVAAQCCKSEEDKTSGNPLKDREYSSPKELCLYEEKCHQLIKLQIQLRVLNTALLLHT